MKDVWDRKSIAFFNIYMSADPVDFIQKHTLIFGSEITQT